MKAIYVSTGLFAVSILSSSALSTSSPSRVDRLEMRVAELRLAVEQLQQQIASSQSHTEIARAQIVEDTPTSSRSFYRVQSGDTLWRIANRHDISVKSLQRSNPRLDPKRLRVGLNITIPSSSYSPERKRSPLGASGGTYRIQDGDTLGHIAQRHGIRLRSLIVANPGVNPRRLIVGKKIYLPSSANNIGSSHKAAAPPIPTPVVSKMPPPLPEPRDQPKLIHIKESQRFSYIAQCHGTDIATLNRLNDVNLPAGQLIKAGSKVYVPSY